MAKKTPERPLLCEQPSRRAAIKQLGALALVAPGLKLTACGGAGQGAGPDAAAGLCRLTPQQTAGPFYFDPNLLRSDIVDDRQGEALQVILTIVDLDCEPIAGLDVDLWHADAAGLYSGYTGQGDGGDIDTTGQSFLRGRQVTDGLGQVSFATVYPGWYPGRTPHLHARVWVSGNAESTTQIYFDDTVTDQVYAGAPYSTRPNRSTRNDGDGIFLGEAQPSLLLAELTGDAGTRRAELSLVIAA